MNKKNEVLYNPFENVDTINSDENQQTHQELYPFKTPKNMLEASVVFEGNTERMLNVLNKAKNGEKVNLITIGGSITEGSGRSNGEYYGDLLERWFKNKFNNENINYINCGRGTTTSLFGCSRIERDIALLNPDLIIVEYAVNNTILEEYIAKETFESLLKKLISLPSKPCVFILFSCLGNITSTQPLDMPIGKHYNLPMASFADALKFHLEEKFKTSDLTKIPENYIIDNFIYDGCHPNTYGYSLLCDFITFQLENAMNNQTADINPYKIPDHPLVSDRFMTSSILKRDELSVLNNNGWGFDDRDTPYIQHGYKNSTLSSSITFEFNCKILTLVSRISVSPRAGIVSIQIDNNEPYEIDSFFHNGWGTYNDYQVIIDEKETSKHTVTINYLDKKTDAALQKAKDMDIPENEVASKFIIVEFMQA